MEEMVIKQLTHRNTGLPKQLLRHLIAFLTFPGVEDVATSFFHPIILSLLTPEVNRNSDLLMKAVTLIRQNFGESWIG